MRFKKSPIKELKLDRAPDPHFPRIPTRQSYWERLFHWLKDIALAREEALWIFTAFLSVQLWFRFFSYTQNSSNLASLYPNLVSLGLSSLFCLVGKGLDIFRIEKRLSVRRSLHLYPLLWLITTLPAAWVSDWIDGAFLMTVSILTIFSINLLCNLAIRISPKQIFFVGDPTPLRATIASYLGERRDEGLRIFYKIMDPNAHTLYGISSIIVPASGVHSHATVDFLMRGLQSGVTVVDESDLFTALFGKAPVFGSIDDCKLILEIEARLPISEFAMRLFNIIFASLGLLFISPFMACIALLIKLESRGPVFFIQKRQGRHNTPFKMFKFRTMIDHANKGPTAFTVANDPRVTRIGKLLRHFHLDELPQLLNVIRGEMSLVGPRPEALFFADQMRQKIPAYDLRYTVRPGMTGWAQLSLGYTLEDVESVLEKLSYDFYYLRNRNLYFDLSILLRTLFFVWHDTSYQQRTRAVTEALLESSQKENQVAA